MSANIYNSEDEDNCLAIWLKSVYQNIAGKSKYTEKDADEYSKKVANNSKCSAKDWSDAEKMKKNTMKKMIVMGWVWAMV